MDFSLIGNKRKKTKKERKYVSIDIPVLRAGGHEYTEINFDELKRDHLDLFDESSGEDERFHDRDALEIARRLEAKYNKKGKKKKIRFNEDDFIDKSRGYDLEDAFIDDSEAFEEALPSTMDTLKGGFYVNRGQLEFRQIGNDEEDDVEEIDKANKSKKKNKENAENSDDEATKRKKAAEDPPPARMTGAPPTKRAISQNEQPTEAKRKRLVGMPPTLRKAEKSSEIAEKEKPKTSNEQSNGNSAPKLKRVSPPPQAPPKVQANPSSSSTSTDDGIIVLDAITIDDNGTSENGNAKKIKEVQKVPEKTEKSNDFVKNKQAVLSLISEDRKKSLHSQENNEKLKTLLEEFAVEITNFQRSGKKQLTPALVDYLVKIEDLYGRQARTSELSMLIEQLSKHIKISVPTIKLRIQQRRMNLASAKEKQQKEDDNQPTSSKSCASSKSNSNVQGSKMVRNEDLPYFTAGELSVLNTALINFRKEVILSDELVNEFVKAVAAKKLDVLNCIETLKKFRESCPKVATTVAPSSSQVAQSSGEQKQRKSRVYLNVWIDESLAYFKAMSLNPSTPFRANKEREIVALQMKMVEVAKECLAKSLENYLQTKESAQKQGSAIPNFSFQYNDYFISNLNNYLDAIYEISLKAKKTCFLYTSLTSIHQQLASHVSKGMFLIEVCRRLPKMSVLLTDESAKKVLAEAKLSAEKFQVVQNSKYMLKWPDNMQPSGVNTPKTGALPPATSSRSQSTSSGPSSTSKPSTSSSSSATTSSSSSKKQSDEDVQVLSTKIAPVAKNATPNKSVVDEVVTSILFTQMNQAIPVQQKQAILMQYRLKYGDTVFQMALTQVQASLTALNGEKKKTEEIERKKKEEAEKKRKEEAEKKRKEEMERLRLENERKAEEKRRQAEEKKRKMEQERIEKERLKAQQREEERLRKEREAKEAKEKKEREEEERRREQERLQRELDKLKMQKEAAEAERIEKERQKRLEQEKMNAEIVRKKQWNDQMEQMRAKQQAVEEQRTKEVKPIRPSREPVFEPVIVKKEPVSQEIEEADRYMERVLHEAEAAAAAAASKSRSGSMSSHQNNFAAGQLQNQNQFSTPHIQSNPQMNANFTSPSFNQPVQSPVSTQIRSPIAQQYPQSPQFQNSMLGNNQNGFQQHQQMGIPTHQQSQHFNRFGQMQSNSSMMPMGFGGMMNQGNQQAAIINRMQQEQWMQQQQQQHQQQQSQQQMFMNNRSNFNYR